MREQPLTQEDIGGSRDPNVVVEMRVTLNEFPHHNQNLEDNVLNNQQHQQETTPGEKMEVFDP